MQILTSYRRLKTPVASYARNNGGGKIKQQHMVSPPVCSRAAGFRGTGRRRTESGSRSVKGRTKLQRHQLLNVADQTVGAAPASAKQLITRKEG